MAASSCADVGRRLLPWFVVVVALGLPDSVRGQEIFREISIRPYGSITLGAPFGQRDSLATELAPNVFALPPGFGGTNSIVVVLSSSGDVFALIFEYGADREFEAMLADYATSLGEPDAVPILKRTDAPVGGEVCALWEDDRTRFEIFETVGGDMPVLLSAMLDRTQSFPAGRCQIPRLLDLIREAKRG